MSYQFFAIPSSNGRLSDTVLGDPDNADRPCFTHYSFTVADEGRTWESLSKRRGIGWCQAPSICHAPHARGRDGTGWE